MISMEDRRGSMSHKDEFPMTHIRNDNVQNQDSNAGIKGGKEDGFLIYNLQEMTKGS